MLERALKPVIFLLASLPVLLLLAGAFGVAGQSLGPNPIREMLHVTGKTALNLLMITLMASPLREITRQLRWQRPRRMLGLFAFAYALLHFLVYALLELDLDFRDLAREISRRPFIIVGTAALLAMVPLAATSTDRMMRRLGRRWSSLHKLMYPIALLGVWHYYWQVKAALTEPLLYAAALAILLGFRVLQRSRVARAANRD
ncbi:MAG: sulfoxide reductase heme-binding subunit YedZ [Gammaproteobacteria bacterium]|nr:sulfoxide reductase heme-binding subunit YedZ [Gammaproteobacteria bacterium]